DYIVILLEYLFELLAERLVRATLEASLGFPREVSIYRILDLILGGKPPAVERRPDDGREAVPLEQKIREVIDPDVLRSIRFRIEEASVNPGEAKGYLSTKIRLAARG